MKLPKVDPFWESMLILILVTLLLALFAGCVTTKAPEQGLIEAKPIPVATPALKPIIVQPRPKLNWDGKHAEAGLWTEYALQAIEASKLPGIVPKDADKWCPKYAKLSKGDRVVVWAALVSKMVERESGFKPQASFQESFNDSKGRPVISRGLLQISQESANSYKCGVVKAEMLHEAKLNLTCGVKIIERWIERDGVFSGYAGGKWLGVGRYWSVMRSRSGSYAKIQAYMRAYPLCK